MLVGLLALLLGLAIGKAWERYKLREGRGSIAARPASRRTSSSGSTLVVAPDRSGDRGADAGGGLDQDALEIHLVLGNLYREKGQVGRAIHIHQRCCSVRGSRRWSTRTSCSAWASTSGAAVSWTAPTKRSRKCCGSTRRTGMRWSTGEAARRTAPVGRGLRDAAAARRSRRRAVRPAAIRPSSRSSKTSSAKRRCGRATRRGRGAIPGGDRSRQERDAGVPQSGRYPGARRATGRAALADVGADRRDRAGARLSRLRSPAGGLSAARHAAAVRGDSAVAWSPATRRTGAPGSPWPGIAPASAGRVRRRSSCSSRRSATTRTRWRFTRRSGRRSRRSAVRRSCSSATSRSPATPSSISIRTSACAAATAARSCSGNARSATSGTRSSRNASRPPRTTSSSA